MTFNTKELLQDLSQRAKNHIAFAKSLQKMDAGDLLRQPAPGKWNALQCLEHLNRYGNFYLPEIGKRISDAKPETKPEFKSGWLGNYLAQSMLPKENLNKMKTFKAMNPINEELNPNVIDAFISQQIQLLELLEQAENVNLSKVKTSISITKLIRLRLGDTLRFLVYHNERHVQQARKTLSANGAA